MNNDIDVSELIKFTKTLKILYVEDNLEARETTACLLENFFDDIVIAVNGLDGLNKFNDDIDIIISDIDMPKMNGIEMTKKIRELNSDVYILIFSAHKESGYLKNIRDIAANDYISKPIDITQFIDLLSSLHNSHINS